MARIVYFLHDGIPEEGAMAFVPSLHRNMVAMPLKDVSIDEESGMVGVPVKAGDANPVHRGLPPRRAEQPQRADALHVARRTRAALPQVAEHRHDGRGHERYQRAAGMPDRRAARVARTCAKASDQTRARLKLVSCQPTRSVPGDAVISTQEVSCMPRSINMVRYLRGGAPRENAHEEYQRT